MALGDVVYATPGQIGFVKVGWWLPGAALETLLFRAIKSGIRVVYDEASPHLQEERHKRGRALYAFVASDVTLYVGRTTRTLHDRMEDYMYVRGKGEANQTKKMAERIRARLDQGSAIEIWALFPEPVEMWKGIVAIDLTAGLEEDVIIKTGSASHWNTPRKGI